MSDTTDVQRMDLSGLGPFELVNVIRALEGEKAFYVREAKRLIAERDEYHSYWVQSLSQAEYFEQATRKAEAERDRIRDGIEHLVRTYKRPAWDWRGETPSDRVPWTDVAALLDR